MTMGGAVYLYMVLDAKKGVSLGVVMGDGAAVEWRRTGCVVELWELGWGALDSLEWFGSELHRFQCGRG